jgi:hypothetical protein
MKDAICVEGSQKYNIVKNRGKIIQGEFLSSKKLEEDI